MCVIVGIINYETPQYVYDDAVKHDYERIALDIQPNDKRLIMFHSVIGVSHSVQTPELEVRKDKEYMLE